MRYPFHFVICISVSEASAVNHGVKEAKTHPATRRVALLISVKNPLTPATGFSRGWDGGDDLPEYRRAIGQTRILRKWRSNADSPLEALQQTALKRKIMLRALETRVNALKSHDSTSLSTRHNCRD